MSMFSSGMVTSSTSNACHFCPLSFIFLCAHMIMPQHACERQRTTSGVGIPPSILFEIVSFFTTLCARTANLRSPRDPHVSTSQLAIRKARV